MRSYPVRPRKSARAGDGPHRWVCVRAQGQWGRTVGTCGPRGARVGPGRAHGGPDRARGCHEDDGGSGGGRTTIYGSDVAGTSNSAQKWKAESPRSRYRPDPGRYTPSVSQSWEEVATRSVSQSEERVSLGDLSGRPWLGCVRSVLWWAGLVGVVGRCASIVLRVGASARRVVVCRWVR